MMRAWLRSLSKQWLGTPRTRRHRARRQGTTARRTFELLEDRVTPAQLTVISALDPATLTAGTLRYALQQARTDAAGGISDTIVLNPAQMGSSTISLQQGALELTAGSGTITIDGGHQIVLSGNNASSIFQVDAGAQAVLTGLTLTGGAGSIVHAGTTATINGAPTPVTYSSGGAINNAGNLRITQSTLTGNVAGGLYGFGGAIYNAGTLTVTSSTLANNAAADAAGWGGGGAIYNAGSLTVTNSTLVNNGVTNVATITGLGTSPQAGGGGAIDNVGTLTMTDATVAGNAAATGGGLDNTGSGTITLHDTIVATNSAGTAPDVAGRVSGNNNLIGQGAGLSGISNRDIHHNQVGTTTAPLNPLLAPVGSYGGPVPTMALLAGSPALRAGAAVSGITADERGSPRPATPDIGAFQSQAVASFAVRAPANAIAGASFPVTITALDQNGNPVTTYSGSDTLASSDGQSVNAPANPVALINGTATTAVTLNAPDRVTLKATSGGLRGTSGTIAVSPAVASFAVSAPGTATAGTGFGITITAVDRFGNTVSGYNGPVTLTSSDGQPISGLPASLTLSNGSAQLTIALDTANTVTLTAGAGSVQGSSASITISPAAAASFAVSAPSTAGAGQGFTVTLTATDAYGNVVTTYSGTPTFSSSDGQTVITSPATPAWSNGLASVTVTLNNPNPNPVTLRATAGGVSGSVSLAVESTASQAISNGLAALMNWAAGQSFPLVGTATAIQNALQVGLLNPINAYLAQNTPTSPGFLTLLESLSCQIGDLTVTVDPSRVAETITGNQVMFSLDFQATQTRVMSLHSLGAQADKLGIRLDAGTKVDVTTSLNFNFTFGVDQTPGLSAAQAFFLNLPAGGLSASVAINTANLTSALTIGFLGAQTTNGTIQMNAQIANASGVTNLGISGLQQLTPGMTGSVRVVLPVQARLGSQDASGTLKISAASLAGGAVPAVSYQGFAGWQNFSTVGPDAVLNMLDQLAGQLGQVGAQLWSTNLPFLNSLSLAQAADLEQAFRQQLTDQLASWSDAAQRTVVNFTTAQDLASVLARVLDLSPSQIGVHFDPTTNYLTYNLSLSAYTFSNLLAQALQVNLNQGGLANASLTGGQLSLVPRVTANFTFGINLTPLGQGFVMTASTPLSALNGGAGVRVNGSSPDLQITLTDGSSFQVSLAGARTVQDVINAIQSASGGKVVVSIDPSTRQALDITQVSPVPGNGASAQSFTVAAINNSYAAADLGIAGSDVGGTGTITGRSLSGDSLQKHVFLTNATFQASVAGAASQVNATADLGAVALQMVNGTGTIQVQASLTLPNLTTLDQLTSALKGATSLSNLVTAQVSGNAQLNLPLRLAVPLAGVTLPSGALVAVTWTDITNPDTLTVTVTPALNLSNLTIAPVLQGLQQVAQFARSAGSSLLSQQLPGLGTTLGGVIDPAALLSAALDSLSRNVPATIDQLANQLSTVLGQPVSVSFINNVLLITLKYRFSTTQGANLGFNLSPSLGSIADVNGSEPLSLTVSGSAVLGLAIDLTNPASPQFYLQDSSKITVGALVNATGISFNASVGPLGLSISGGSVRLDNGTQGQPATWTASLQPGPANHLWPLASAAGEITSAIAGQINIVLPTFFPTPDQPLDPNTPNIELHVTDVSNPGSTTTVLIPDLSAALGSISLNDIMDQVVNGWDGVLRMLRAALVGEIKSVNIPVLGTQLQQALDFLQTLDDTVTQALANAPQLAATTVQDALYNALGPNGLNWLANLSADGAAGENNYVQLTQSTGYVHYLIKLHEGLTPVSVPLGVNLGLPGLGLAVNGNLTLNAGFDATLGFGLSEQYGFFVDSTDTAGVGFNAQLLSANNALITASLGFLQFTVSNNAPQTPLASGGLTLGLNDVNGTGRLSVDDLASSSAYTLGVQAGVNVNFHLDATIGGNADLPHLSTDFAFAWSPNPTAANPNQLGFSNITLDLGGFIDNLANQIGKVLAPIKPLADVLTAPLPVLSQLAGHKVDLVDLASALGFCSQGTADFLNAVAAFVSGGGLDIPTSMDLGSMTLDPSAAANPSSLGNMNPETTDITSSYDGNPITGFEIPILSNPASAFQMLLGKDVPLVTYETPALNLSFAFDEFFPIIGPLGADLAGEIGAQAQFGFGFDTSGFRAYAAGHFRDPSLILDGFYVSDRANPDGTGPVTPQVQLYGSIAAYAALDLGIVEAGIGGGLFATVGFTVHDPTGTGKVHLNELVADVQKGTIFDAVGALQAFLRAFVKIDLGIISHTWYFDIASITLAQIGEPAPSTPPVPQLATALPGGELRLNIGPYAPERLYGTTADGNETLTVTPGPNPNSVYVSGFGVTNQEYDNVTKITGEGAAGNDTLVINAGSGIDVDLEVGGGTNRIDVQSAGNVTLTGGAGNDTLEVDNATSAILTGGPGTEVLIVTRSEPATLRAGSGKDALYGGSGAGQVLIGGSGTNLLVGGSGANQILHGGSGVSTLVGGSGAGQQLLGERSTANLFGGTGNNQTLVAGSGNDHLYAGEADGQVLQGGSGNNVLQAGWHLPNPSAAIAFGNLPVGAIDPTTGQPLAVGWHLQERLTASGWTVTNYTPGDTNQGAGHSYLMKAGTGNTLIIGGWGDDTLYGGSGNNTLYGGGGNGTKVLYAGVGATQMYGGGPGNNVSPSTGTHFLYGGSGNDVLYGGDGCNITPNATGTGLINAAGDSGDNGVNILVAGSGNSTLYSDSVGDHTNTLIAGSGLDKLFAGGTSGDYLEAGSGVDSLYGGTGNDVFQLPFIPVGQQAATPDTLVGGFGLTTLVLKPVETVQVNGQLTQVSLTTDSNITLNSVAGTSNQYLATLSDLDSGNVAGQVQFILPSTVERIALLGGQGDNLISVDPSVQRGTFLYGGPGHNILISGSGNDDLVGGSGTSVLEGGSGNDVLYGGAIPAVYQKLINSLGAGPGGPVVTGAPTSNVLMTWLRQQPAGHNYLIAGSGNTQLYAGNGGDLMIGGNAHFDAPTGQFILDPGAGRDLFGGGQGNDLMIGGASGAGDVMMAGSGNSVLIGGNGENVLEGGGGSDVLIGGSLINIMMSNSTAGAASTLLGGTGLNFEFAGAGSDQLFDYASATDPLQAGAWAQAQALANQYHVALPAPAANSPINPAQAYQALQTASNNLSTEFALLNTIYLHPTQTGSITKGTNTISNLYFMRQSGTVTGGQSTVTGLDTSQLINGEMVTGPGIPAGTTLTIPVDAQGNPIPGEIVLSNVVTSAGTSTVPLTFSDPVVVAPVWESGTVTRGSNTVRNLADPIALAGYTTSGSPTITGLASTASLALGDTVSGPGIPADATVVRILDAHSVLLSKNATATAGTPVVLSVSKHLTIGQPVTGPGIPAGTTIAAIVSGTSITLSNRATATTTGATLCFGSVPFAGPLVAAPAGDLPDGDSVAAILNGTSVTLAQNATQTATVQLTFTLTPEEEHAREALNNALQTFAFGEVNVLRSLGANVVTDFLQGGSGTDALYVGAAPVWMVGSNGHDTFYISPANYSAFANNLDTIEGSSLANDTLMFLGDGDIHVAYDDTQFADVLTVQNAATNATLTWKEGNNVSTVGVQTLGGNDTVAIDSAKFGSWTGTIRVLDGGFLNYPGLQGSVVIDASAFTEQGFFLGGVGSDTIKIGVLAYGSLVQGGTGNNQYNELDVLGINGGSQVIEGIDPLTGQENLQDNGVWVGDANFQKLVVVGGTGSNTFQTDGQIANVILEGGSGTNVMTAYNGTNTLIGGTGTNTMTASGGSSTLIGGAGQNTFSFTGAGLYNVIGGQGSNVINADAGTYTILGGLGQNSYNFTGAGSYDVIGGPGENRYYITSAGTYTLTGGAGANFLDIRCATSGDAIWLVQNGANVSAVGYINGAYFSVAASNMNSIEADGSQAGNCYLDASRMTLGVLLKGAGSGNTLFGGAGQDTLDGGSGGDNTLVAGNNSDRLYVSGDWSYYYGTGSNTLVYRAQPNDNIAVYQHGLLVNGQLQYGNNNGQGYSYLTGTYHPFGYVGGIGTVEIEDGTGTATAHFAQQWETPGYAYYSYDTSHTVYLESGWHGWVTGTGNYNYTFYVPIYVVGESETAYANWSWSGATSNPVFTWGSWTYNSSWPYNPTGIYFTISGGLFNGRVDIYVNVTGYQGTWNWNYYNYYYGVWQNPPNLVVDPGINVAPSLTVLATDANGAVVNYPHSFTTGGASPQTSGLTYSIPSGSVFPIGTTPVTATATDGSGRTSQATFNVVVLPAPAVASAPTAQAVLNADQFDAGIGEFVNQVAASPTFDNSTVPVIQQMSSLITLAQQDAVTLQPYSAFDQEVTAYLNDAATTGQAGSLSVQQQVIAFANMAGNGEPTSPDFPGLPGSPSNRHAGGRSATPFHAATPPAAPGLSPGTVPARRSWSAITKANDLVFAQGIMLSGNPGDRRTLDESEATLQLATHRVGYGTNASRIPALLLQESAGDDLILGDARETSLIEDLSTSAAIPEMVRLADPSSGTPAAPRLTKGTIEPDKDAADGDTAVLGSAYDWLFWRMLSPDLQSRQVWRPATR
jgi:Ca2+-binding RTX toxin-like protein